MPKELTHWIIAQRALDAMDAWSETSNVLRDHYDFYLAGAVLPDTLLHLVRGPDAGVALNLADLFHDAGKNSYAPLIMFEEKAKKALSADTKACLLGVLCHMQADIVFHPFVHSLSGWEEIGMHYRLETEIDCCLIRRGALPPVRSLNEIITPSLRKKLTELCVDLFDPQGKLSKKGVEDALELHCKYQGMYDDFLWKMLAVVGGHLPLTSLKQQRHLFYPVFRSGRGKKLAGEGSWEHPVSGLLQTSTLNDLVDLAVRRSARLFMQINDQNSFKGVLGNAKGENLLTGIYGVQKKELQYKHQTMPDKPASNRKIRVKKQWAKGPETGKSG